MDRGEEDLLWSGKNMLKSIFCQQITILLTQRSNLKRQNFSVPLHMELLRLEIDRLCGILFLTSPLPEPVLGIWQEILTRLSTILRSQEAKIELRVPSAPSEFFLSQCDLFNLQHTVNFLSWRGTRGSQDTGTYVVHCRLDRALANSDWSDLFSTAKCHYLLYEGSDHGPLVSVFDPTKLKS